MPDRSSKKKKKPTDINLLAAAIVAEATLEEEDGEAANIEDGKNPAAVALGRLGGRKGGKARSESLTAEERSRIARVAAQARWSKGRKDADGE